MIPARLKASTARGTQCETGVKSVRCRCLDHVGTPRSNRSLSASTKSGGGCQDHTP